MATITQALATVLGIHIEYRNKQPLWHAKRGTLLIELGSCQTPELPSGLSLQEACQVAISKVPGDLDCGCLVIPADSPRTQIYMEIEGEIMRQEQADGEFIVDAIADNDPRDAIELVMEQLRDCALSLGKPQQLVVTFLRLAVLAVTALQWAERWFAMLQKAPLETTIHPKIILPFSRPPAEIPSPKPLKPEPPSTNTHE